MSRRWRRCRHFRLGADFGELFTQLDGDADRLLESRGVLAQAKHEKATWRHHFADPEVDMPMLHAVGQMDENRQMLNPVRVLTSGVERRATQPFFASGQWRFAERVRWWDDYTDDVPVVVGHYWRQFLPLDRKALGKGDPDLFDGVSPQAWLGPRGRVFCVDFSVGGRWQERKSPEAPPRSRLALLRWPERTLVLDTGEMVGTRTVRTAVDKVAQEHEMPAIRVAALLVVAGHSQQVQKCVQLAVHIADDVQRAVR